MLSENPHKQLVFFKQNLSPLRKKKLAFDTKIPVDGNRVVKLLRSPERENRGLVSLYNRTRPVLFQTKDKEAKEDAESPLSGPLEM